MKDEHQERQSDAEKIDLMVEFGGQKDRDLLSVYAEMKGLIETEVFLESLFIERDACSFETILQKLNILWRKEFEKMLSRSLLTY